MYQLYIDDKACVLKVLKLAKVFENSFPKNLSDDEVYDYNTLYKFSKSRKALVQVARELKAQWIEQAERRVEEIKAIKI